MKEATEKLRSADEAEPEFEEFELEDDWLSRMEEKVLWADSTDDSTPLDGIGAELGDSWRRFDASELVAGIANGTIEPPRPTVGRLADGSHWLYPGRTNGLAGESGCGKSWTALATVASELEDGNAAIYIDFEDNPLGIFSRMIAMGLEPDVLVSDRFAYIQPSEKVLCGWDELCEQIERVSPTLVVIDSTGESMALEGVDQNVDPDVANWFRMMANPIAKLGPAVLLVDHLPKADNAAWHPIGSQRKKASISGVQMVQTVKTGMAFAKGHPGEAGLVCTKDRSGYFVSGKVVMKLLVNPNDTMADGSGCEVSMLPFDSVQEQWAPTKHMAEISLWLQGCGPAAMNTVNAHVTGKKETLAKGLAVLVESGYLSVADGPRNSKVYTFVKLYKNGDPITVPANLDDAAAVAASGQDQCNDPKHPWHADQKCNPGWCHMHHHGQCNELVARGLPPLPA